MSDALYLCDCTREGGEAKEMRRATGTWLTPRHACEAAVLLMAERVGACQQQHAAEDTMVSHHSAGNAHAHTHTRSHYIYCHPLLPVQCWGLELNSQVVESNSYAINLIWYSVEVYFHLIQTTACIAKGNYISTASICPEVVDSQSKPPQVFLPLSTLSVKSTERFLGSSMIYLSEIFIM